MRALAGVMGIWLLAGCGQVVSLGSTDGGSSADANSGTESGSGDGGMACVPCTGSTTNCVNGCDTTGQWTPIANRTLNFFITVAGQCGDGGYVIQPVASDGGSPDIYTSAGPQRVTPIACPPVVSGDCSSTTVCSWDPNASPEPPFYGGLFQVVGRDPAGSAGLQQGNEVAVTFSVPSGGLPVSVGVIARRLSQFSGPTGNADLLADIVPVVQGVPSTSSYLVRARYDTDAIPFMADPSQNVDVPVIMTFETNAHTLLSPGQVYALYLHIESPGVDHIGLAGTVTVTDPNSVTFARQVDSDGGFTTE